MDQTGITSNCIIHDRNKCLGYVQISVNGKKMYYHRWIWEQKYGPIPDDKKVLHKCDNPACINVDHLFLGTQKDNVQDAVNKGRHSTCSKEGLDQLYQKRVEKWYGTKKHKEVCSKAGKLSPTQYRKK